MIRFDHINITFGDKVLFRDFSLSVNQGEKVLLFGPSGTGKSSLLKLLLGFIRPDSGSVYFENKEIGGTDVWPVRKRFAYIPQGLDIGEGTVQEVLDSVFSLKTNSDSRVNGERFISYLELLRFDENILEQDYSALSGGEKQRIAIIAGLMMERNIFLLDEATSSLDAELKRKVVDLFASEKKWTVISVSHDTVWETRSEFTSVHIGGNG